MVFAFVLGKGASTSVAGLIGVAGRVAGRGTAQAAIRSANAKQPGRGTRPMWVFRIIVLGLFCIESSSLCGATARSRDRGSLLRNFDRKVNTLRSFLAHFDGHKFFIAVTNGSGKSSMATVPNAPTVRWSGEGVAGHVKRLC